MLVLRKSGGEGVDCDFNIMGQTIVVKIMHLDVAGQEAIREKHKQFKFIKDPETKQMQRVVWTDIDGTTNEMIDRTVMGITGVADEKGNPIEMTLANKKAVMFLRADSDDALPDEMKTLEEEENMQCPECGSTIPIPEQYRQRKPLLWLLVMKRATELTVMTEEQWRAQEKN